MPNLGAASSTSLRFFFVYSAMSSHLPKAGRHLNALQVRVAERGRVLQAVAEEPVAADVDEPDERELGRSPRVGQHTRHTECYRPHVRVREVVRQRTDARAGEEPE